MKLSAVCLVFAIGACGPGSGNNGDDAPAVDAGVGEETCVDDSECSATFPICSAAGTCVQCESSADCPVDMPVCGNGTCGASCAGDEVNADFIAVPSDIIWVVDQSGSMNQETAYVQAQINNFVTLISASNIDYRVVMIARDSSSNAICVPAPLGGAACGNNTNFRLVDQYVDSRNGPALAVSTYNLYSDFLRLDAMKHFIFVTDDDSNQTAATFTNGLAALAPTGMFANYKVHGIYGYSPLGGTCTGAFGSAVRDGAIYTQLITSTMGARGVICDNDWTTVFTDITAAVVAGSRVACELDIPAPSQGGTVDPAKVNVKYQMGGVAPGVTLSQVQTSADCGSGGGWYYDDNTTPTKITLCPTTCTDIQADPAANVKIELGCSTQIF